MVLYLHGIEGHGQWFENTARVLHQKGITVYAPDRRGAGLNPRDRGHLADYKTFLADVDGLLRRISTQHAGHAIVLMANCWSAKAAAMIAREDYKPVEGGQQVALSGLVLTSPAIATKVDLDLNSKFRIAYTKILGNTRRTWNIPIKPSMFTNNQKYLDFIERDPLRLREATGDFFIESLKLTNLAQASAPHIKVPLLILQSGADEIVDIEKVEKWYAKVKSVQKSMRVFPDAAHSIDFDQTWFKEYTHLLTEWLLSRTPAVSA